MWSSIARCKEQLEEEAEMSGNTEVCGATLPDTIRIEMLTIEAFCLCIPDSPWQGQPKTFWQQAKRCPPLPVAWQPLLLPLSELEDRDSLEEEVWRRGGWWVPSSSFLIQKVEGGGGSVEASGWTEVGASCQPAAWCNCLSQTHGWASLHQATEKL